MNIFKIKKLFCSSRNPSPKFPKIEGSISKCKSRSSLICPGCANASSSHRHVAKQYFSRNTRKYSLITGNGLACIPR